MCVYIYIYVCVCVCVYIDRSRLRAYYVSSHTEEFWLNETVCLWMTIYIYIYTYTRVGWKVHRRKSFYDDIISAVNDVFNLWDPHTTTPMKKCVNLCWSHCIRVSWLAYDVFSLTSHTHTHRHTHTHTLSLSLSLSLSHSLSHTHTNTHIYISVLFYQRYIHIVDNLSFTKNMLTLLSVDET